MVRLLNLLQLRFTDRFAALPPGCAAVYGSCVCLCWHRSSFQAVCCHLW